MLNVEKTVKMKHHSTKLKLSFPTVIIG